MECNYERRLQDLCRRKLEQTLAKKEHNGYMNEDDYGCVLPPENFHFEPEFNDPEHHTFYGARLWGRNFRRLMERHPLYVDPNDALAGRWMFILQRLRPFTSAVSNSNMEMAPVFNYEWLKPTQEKYGIIPGIGKMHHFAPDYQIGLQLGFGGLLDKVRQYARQYPEKAEFYQAEEDVLFGMVEMYKEGLIDPEFATREETEKRKVMNSNSCGLAFTQAEQVQLSTDSLRSGGVESATWVGIAPVPGPDGVQALFARSKFGFYTVLTTGAEEKGKVIDILKFFNWMYSDEGIMLNNYGVEGVTYNMVDGKPVMLDNVRESFNTYRGCGMNFQPISSLWTVDAYVQVLTNGTPYEELPETRKLFYDAFYLNDPYFVTSAPILQTEAYIENANTLLAEAAQLQAQCIAGLITIDEFYSRYESLKASGLQDVIDQGTAAYAQMMNE